MVFRADRFTKRIVLILFIIFILDFLLPLCLFYFFLFNIFTVEYSIALQSLGIVVNSLWYIIPSGRREQMLQKIYPNDEGGGNLQGALFTTSSGIILSGLLMLFIKNIFP